VCDEDYILRSVSLKKAEKICIRVGRYYKNKDAKNNFCEEDVDTLEYRNATENIMELHQENYLLLSNVLLAQNNLTEALSIINDSLNKINHKDYPSLLQKVAILKA